MNKKSIGLMELSSVAAGFAVADAMLKAAKVQLSCRAAFAPANTW